MTRGHTWVPPKKNLDGSYIDKDQKQSMTDRSLNGAPFNGVDLLTNGTVESQISAGILSLKMSKV